MSHRYSTSSQLLVEVLLVYTCTYLMIDSLGTSQVKARVKLCAGTVVRNTLPGALLLTVVAPMSNGPLSLPTTHVVSALFVQLSSLPALPPQGHSKTSSVLLFPSIMYIPNPPCLYTNPSFERKKPPSKSFSPTENLLQTPYQFFAPPIKCSNNTWNTVTEGTSPWSHLLPRLLEKFRSSDDSIV